MANSTVNKKFTIPGSQIWVSTTIQTFLRTVIVKIDAENVARE